MNNQRGRDSWRDQPLEKTLDEVWREFFRGGAYLEGGYFDEQGNLKLEYVSRKPVEPLIKAMSQARPQLTMHQLRRFFQHCRAIEAKLKQGVSTWESERTNFAKLDSAAADALGVRPNDFKTKPKKIPRLFHDFVKRNVAAVESEKDFLKGFLPHFESLVGFGAVHLKERENN